LTWNGSSVSVWKTVDDASRTLAVDMICPGEARAINRAATLTASPITVYVRR
jgi:hypothetical protein